MSDLTNQDSSDAPWHGLAHKRTRLLAGPRAPSAISFDRLRGEASNEAFGQRLARSLLAWDSVTNALCSWPVRRSISAAACLAGVWPLSVTSSARADAAPQATVSVEAVVPAGGIVTGIARCDPLCTIPVPQFSAEDGTPVPGAFVDDKAASAERFVFVPDPPLEPGAYSVSVSGLLNTATQPFTVVEATFELPTFTHELTTEVVSEGDVIQCKEQGGDSPTGWFTLQTRVRPAVTVSVQGLYARQYRYGIRLVGETPSPSFATNPRKSFDLVADELCFEVLASSYQDDAITEIGETCVSLAGLGVAILDEMSGDFRQTLLGCVVPPEGYQDNWCTLFEPAFAQQNCEGFALDACFAARRACPNGDQPSAAEEEDERDASQDATGTGGTPGGGGSSVGGSGSGAGGEGVLSGSGSTVGAGGTSGAGGAREEAAPDLSVAAGGCSVGSARPMGALNWLIALTTLLALWRTRRKAPEGAAT